ncbi:MAG: HU family DNA-binding protein [Elusimicrobia bacterium]|nr:HU family DNA-binding protein [Elusimicrobiota bacterium]
MNQNAIVEKVMADAKISNKASAARALKSVVSSIVEALKSDGKITISGLGTFKVKETKARKGRNPKTGEAIDIPASKRVSFKAASGLKKIIKG